MTKMKDYKQAEKMYYQHTQTGADIDTALQTAQETLEFSMGA